MSKIFKMGKQMIKENINGGGETRIQKTYSLIRRLATRAFDDTEESRQSNKQVLMAMLTNLCAKIPVNANLSKVEEHHPLTLMKHRWQRPLLQLQTGQASLPARTINNQMKVAIMKTS